MASAFGFKLTADTKEAQKQIQRLSQEVDRFDEKTRKKRSVGVSAKGGTTTTASTHGTRAASNGGSAFGGSMLGSAIGSMNPLGMIVDNLPKVINGFGTLIGNVFPMAEDALKNMTKYVRQQMQVLDVIDDPQGEALKRAGTIDALDDERRAHNTATNAEEFAWAGAVESVAGKANYGKIVGRLQNILDLAQSGSVSDAERAQDLLKGSGLNFNDLKSQNAWQVLIQLLKAYSAGNMSPKQMQDIFGQGAMPVLRKMGDGSDVERKFADRHAYYMENVQPYESAMLSAADYAEDVQDKARASDMVVRNAQLIKDGADAALSLAREKAVFLSSERDAALNAYEAKMNPPSTGEHVSAITRATTDGLRDSFNAITAYYSTHPLTPAPTNKPMSTMEREAAYDAHYKADMEAIHGRPLRAGESALNRSEQDYDRRYNDDMQRINGTHFSELIDVLKKNTQQTENLTNTITRTNTEAGATFN